MKPFRWNHWKNWALQIQRGISFEWIVQVIEADRLLDERRHSTPPEIRCESLTRLTLQKGRFQA
jgi:hypothetical protein